MNASVTWPQIVTAIVAGAAFILSLVALAVQAITWRRAGFRPEIDWNELHSSAGAKFILTVRNRGRVAGTIDEVWFVPESEQRRTRLLERLRRTSGSFRVLPVGGEGTQQRRLEPYASEKYIFPAASVRELTDSISWTTRLRPEVKFGDGRRLRARPVHGLNSLERSIARVSKATRREIGIDDKEPRDPDSRGLEALGLSQHSVSEGGLELLSARLHLGTLADTNARNTWLARAPPLTPCTSRYMQ